MLAVSMAVTVAMLFAFPWGRDSCGRLKANPTSATMTGNIVRPPHRAWLDRDTAVRRDKDKRRAVTMAQTEDYHEFIRQLRSAGLSEDSIAKLIVAELRQATMGVQEALMIMYQRGEIGQEEFQKQWRALNTDLEARLEELLTKEGYRRYRMQQDREMTRLEETGKFSNEALEQYFILRENRAKDEAALAGQIPRGETLEREISTRIMAMDWDLINQLEQQVGPAAASEILAEADNRAQQLRQSLIDLQLTEDDFTQLASILREYRFKAREIDYRTSAGEETKQLAQQESEKQLRADLLALLGSERYAEFEKRVNWINLRY